MRRSIQIAAIALLLTLFTGCGPMYSSNNSSKQQKREVKVTKSEKKIQKAKAKEDKKKEKESNKSKR